MKTFKLKPTVDKNARTIVRARLVARNGEKKQFCIDDVMATGDLELAEDSFYN